MKKCRFNELNALGFDLGCSLLDSLHDRLIPNNRQVSKLLCFLYDMSTTQTSIAIFFRNLFERWSLTFWPIFLHFGTGSDILLSDGVNEFKAISISFTNVTGLVKNPVAHTCGRVLEISEQYDSVLEFRSEFSSVLTSDIWVMDFA